MSPSPAGAAPRAPLSVKHGPAAASSCVTRSRWRAGARRPRARATSPAAPTRRRARARERRSVSAAVPGSVGSPRAVARCSTSFRRSITWWWRSTCRLAWIAAAPPRNWPCACAFAFCACSTRMMTAYAGMTNSTPAAAVAGSTPWVADPDGDRRGLLETTASTRNDAPSGATHTASRICAANLVGGSDLCRLFLPPQPPGQRTPDGQRGDDLVQRRLGVDLPSGRGPRAEAAPRRRRVRRGRPRALAPRCPRRARRALFRPRRPGQRRRAHLAAVARGAVRPRAHRIHARARRAPRGRRPTTRPTTRPTRTRRPTFRARARHARRGRGRRRALARAAPARGQARAERRVRRGGLRPVAALRALLGAGAPTPTRAR